MISPNLDVSKCIHEGSRSIIYVFGGNENQNEICLTTGCRRRRHRLYKFKFNVFFFFMLFKQETLLTRGISARTDIYYGQETEIPDRFRVDVYSIILVQNSLNL